MEALIPATTLDDGAVASPALAPRDSGIPGNRAIWVGIFAEMTEFALMFLVYFIARAHHPAAFHQGPAKLWTLAGILNTLIMLTSSFLVAGAVHAVRADRQRPALIWLGLGLVTGLGYPLMKVLEFRWNLAQGLTGQGDVFQLAYYYLTFNHLVHVSWGLLGMVWVLARLATGAYTAGNHRGLIAFASYWHATDLIWLMIFPLFYVLP
ncbi:MAG: cytochrome c oxidase subunit 3 family protein [Gammaproteobacteria bacterium]|jgi:cytochrome c oxidase subunit 3|nr:cytochrome c oxidase subunit 3 family protein [Candidatus Thioaporhodococcus sediminis]TNF56420.1 MAG: cytochrome c oxidase subunit 3 family protein [Gammaproteobacteria bacterium]